MALFWRPVCPTKSRCEDKIYDIWKVNFSDFTESTGEYLIKYLVRTLFRKSCNGTNLVTGSAGFRIPRPPLVTILVSCCTRHSPSIVASSGGGTSALERPTCRPPIVADVASLCGGGRGNLSVPRSDLTQVELEQRVRCGRAGPATVGHHCSRRSGVGSAASLSIRYQKYLITKASQYAVLVSGYECTKFST